jgi:PAS domain S-box-containing protein
MMANRKKITIDDSVTGDIGYQAIVEHINEGIVIVKEGKIEFANSAFFEICRKKPADVLGRPFLDLIAPADTKTVSTFLSARATTDILPDRIEFTMKRPDEDGIMEMKVNIIQCAGSLSVLGALTDITERRKTRLELLKMKDRLESILHSMNDVVVSFSPNDRSIVAINPAVEALYGAPMRDFRSGRKHIMDFVHPDDADEVRSFYESIPKFEFAELSYRIMDINDELKWVSDEGRLVYGEMGRVRRIDHVIRDITEEKLAVDALRQSEEKYRSFFESTKDMAYAVKPDGTFTDINEAGVQLLGYKSREEVIGLNIRDAWVNVSERDGLLSELREKGFVDDKRARFKHKDGKIIEVAITARAKLSDAGDIIHYEGLIHNITEAMEDQRNRVLRNAAGGMCHYLNSHLMTLLIAKDCMEEDIASLQEVLQTFGNREIGSKPAAKIKESLISLKENTSSLGDAYEKISRVTNAFNSAFLTYTEESYLDRTILDIFHSMEEKNPPQDKK